MSERVRETDFKSLLKSFFGIDEEDYQQEDLSEEEAIKKCNIITDQEKVDLLNSVKNRAKLEAILDYSQKTKGKSSKSRLKISKNKENTDKDDPKVKTSKKTSREDEDYIK